MLQFPASDEPLEAGQAYTDSLTNGDVNLSMRAPSAPSTIARDDGWLYVIDAAHAQEQPLIAILDLATTHVADSPTTNLDLSEYADLPPAPADALAWFAALPGVTAASTVTTTLAGQPAKAITYTVAAFDDEAQCSTATTEPCLPAFFTAAGLKTFYLAGDAGTMYQVSVDGHPVLVDVSTLDGAAALAQSLTFTTPG
ncbi:MAG: hypothetical protein JWL72_4458 [Ilumatobacteraceae bacterium]|nr:hypothetical protein [Ilumatobacteraceae bacterium]